MRYLVVLAMAFASQSCFTVRYLAQAARGQAAVWAAARPLGDALADPRIAPPTRRLLSAVPEIKAYAVENGLAATRSYDRYADLRRAAAVWVVQASPALALEPRLWRFPIVGTVPYLGFFEEGAARRYAQSLAADPALDVDVRPAGAFSTLGWFPDPVLSTMLGDGDGALGALANVVLHESVHATVYVRDQSPFNESLATFVADRLTAAWLARAVGPDAPEAVAWVRAHARSRATAARLHEVWRALDAVYRSGEGAAPRLAAKERILAEAQSELGLRLNNASLSGHRTYDAGGPALERLLAACGGSVPHLLRTAAALGSADFARPQQERFDAELDRLATAGCPRS